MWLYEEFFGLVLVTCLLGASVALGSRLNQVLLVPTSVEIRLVGLSQEINLKSLQEALDALSTTDIKLLLGIQAELSYTVRTYDHRINPETDLEQTTIGDDLARADDVDQQIAQKHEPFQGMVIYILNSKKRRRSYASDPTRSGDEFCSTQVWSSENERFAWVDLAAVEPLSDYGPFLNGEGYVSFGRAVPKPEDFYRSSFHARLAALCHRTSLHLASPSPSNPKPFVDPFSSFVVRVFLITTSTNDKGLEQLQKRWEANLIAPLKKVAKGINPAVTFEIVPVRMESCAICAAAHEMAIRVKERTDDLDPQKLRDVLLSSSSFASSRNSRTPSFPVVVYRSDTGPLLFEGGRQVVTFNDSIVAIEGTSSEIAIPSRFQCREQGRVVTLDASDVSRQVLAGALTSLFGVSPTYDRYSTAMDRFTQDYLFAIGHTPFGPFSRSTSLSKSLAATVWRNPLLAHLAGTMSSIQQVRAAVTGLKFPKQTELMRLLEDAEAFAHRSAGFTGLLDIEHAKEFAQNARDRVMKAERLFAQLEFVRECYSGDGDEAHGAGSSSNSTAIGLSLIPILLLFTAGAVLYETRVARMRTFVRDVAGPRARRNNVGGSNRDYQAFVAPAKKID